MSHPLRRRILKEIDKNNYITFTTLSNDWGIKTGTIYFHLKELNSILDQNEDKEYILNKRGKKLCEWFIQTDDGKAEIVKIETFTYISNILASKIRNSYLIFIGLLVLSVISLNLATNLEIIVIGTFLLPISGTIIGENLLYFNFIAFSILLVFYEIVGKLIDPNHFEISINSVNIFFLGHFIPFVFIILFTLINLITPFTLNLLIWLILSIIFQIFFISITSSFHITNFGMNISRGLIIGFMVLYLTLLFSLYLS